jgi:2-amino-4-hydroxy-6-hydroxymethyldihydropteridine diphosphokinase
LREILSGLCVSSLFRSAAIGVASDQPAYLNAVATGFTEIAPESILDHLKRLEEAAGRPPEDDGKRLPRTLDLDLLLYGLDVIATPRLRVPHPEMTRRRFVLEPLAELLPDLSVPGTGLTVKELLGKVPPQEIERVGPIPGLLV